MPIKIQLFDVENEKKNPKIDYYTTQCVQFLKIISWDFVALEMVAAISIAKK
jgi:hypothetical protein